MGGATVEKPADDTEKKHVGVFKGWLLKKEEDKESKIKKKYEKALEEKSREDIKKYSKTIEQLRKRIEELPDSTKAAKEKKSLKEALAEAYYDRGCAFASLPWPGDNIHAYENKINAIKDFKEAFKVNPNLDEQFRGRLEAFLDDSDFGPG